MIIDGKQIADEVLQKLRDDVEKLKQKGIIPTLAVILVGDNSASESYVRQKQKAALKIGADLRIMNYDLGIKKEEILQKIHQLNNDICIHGSIIQRPLPDHLQNMKILNSIKPNKDVDGFVSNSKFTVPVAMAVEKILAKIYELRFKMYDKKKFYSWLKNQNIVIIGRGETAGKPITDYFTRKDCHVSIVHSQTAEQEKLRTLKNADIIISCVGKQGVVTLDKIKKVILISVGIWRDSEGKLHGDYEEDDIKEIASFYTPTPGGIGPVNVACLMQNLVSAASTHILT